MNEIKLHELVSNVFRDYPYNACLYIGKYRFKTEGETTPEVDVCFPWEATDVEDIPFSVYSRGPIITSKPKESIDKLLMFFLDDSPTNYFTVVHREPGKDYYMYIDRHSDIYVTKV